MQHVGHSDTHARKLPHTLPLRLSSSSSVRLCTSGGGGAALGTSSQARSATRRLIRSSRLRVVSSVGAGGGRTARSKSRSTSSALFTGRAPARQIRLRPFTPNTN